MSAQGSLLPNGRQQIFDANGNPLVGGFVYFYVPGTETPSTTWQNPAMTIPNTNPVVLDDLGSMSAYGTGSYRQIVQDASGNQLWDEVVDAGVNSSGQGGSGGVPVQPGAPGAGTTGIGTTVGPAGSVGVLALSVLLAEAVAAGAPVNFFLSGTSLVARNANASNQRECHGFAAGAASAGSTVDIYIVGIVGGLAGIQPGQDYYLGTSPGTIAQAGAKASGQLYQPVASGLDTTSIVIRLGVSVAIS